MKSVMTKVIIVALLLCSISTTWPLQIFAAINDGLVAYYPFNGNANDESGNGNHGTVYGAALTQDRFGNVNSAYRFDGVNDYISAQHSDSLNIIGPLTISVWVQLNGTQEDHAGVINKITSGGSRPGYLITIWPDQTALGYLLYAWPNSGGSAIGKTVSQVNDLNWHHILFVYDGLNVAIYFDGHKECSPCSENYTNGMASNNEPLRIGVDPGYTMNDRLFNGNIDDIRIYNRSLSDSEVQELYLLKPSAVDRGVNWLLQRQGPLSGWESETVNNAVAVRAYVANGRTDSPTYQILLNKLYALQSANGSWTTNDNWTTDDTGSIQNTAQAIWALVEAGESVNSNVIQRAVKWLDFHTDFSDTSTGLTQEVSDALIGLVKGGMAKTSQKIIEGVNWLRTNQDSSDGFWGGFAGEPSYSWSPWPVFALSIADSSSSPEVQRAVNYYRRYAYGAPVMQILGLTMFNLAGTQTDIQNARNAVLASQKADGGWSHFSLWNSEGWHTSSALEGLGGSGYTGTEITYGFNWIEKNISSDGALRGDRENVNPTLWAVSALSASGRADVSTALTNAKNALVNSRHYSASWCWMSLLQQCEGDNFATGQVAWALNNMGYTDLQATVAYLKLAQNPDGGWGVLMSSDQSILKISLLDLIGMISSGVPATDPALIKGLDYLISQSSNSHWPGFIQTAQAVFILSKTGYNTQLLSDAVQWLLDNQGLGGSWGGNTDATAMAMLALNEAGVTGLPMVQGASWLMAAQNMDGGWNTIPGVAASLTQPTGLAVWALSLQDYSGIPVNVLTDMEEYFPGETVAITITTAENVSRISGVVTGPDGQGTELIIAGAGRGFTSTFNIAEGVSLAGTYTISIQTSNANGTGVGNKNFGVLYRPDLSLNSSGIGFDVFSPQPGVPVTITASIANLGALYATGVPVTFYDGAVPIGEVIIPQAPAGAVAQIEITTSFATAGIHIITVKVDPLGTIAESNESNNDASQIYQVGDTPDFHADIVLQNGSPSTLPQGAESTISGLASYLVEVNGVVDTNNKVKGGNVYAVIRDSANNVLFSDNTHYTDVNGYYTIPFPALGADGDVLYLYTEVTDQSLTGTLNSAITIAPPPAGPCTDCSEPPPNALPSPGMPGTTQGDPILPPPCDQNCSVDPATDLYIQSQEIFFNNDLPQSGEEIDITFTVRAQGAGSARNVPLILRATYPTVGTIDLGYWVIDRIDAGESVTITQNWRSYARGVHIIEAALGSDFTDPDSLNNAATREITVGDNEAPQSSITCRPLPNATAWNNTAVNCSIIAVDNAGGLGVKEIRYQIGATPGQTVSGATASFRLTAEEIYSITYHSVDNAGNTETPSHSHTVSIDTTPPATSATCLPAPNANGWNKTDVTCLITATDNGSGVKGVYYQVQREGFPLEPEIIVIGSSASVSIITGGIHTITYFAEDKAGNMQVLSNTHIVKIDKTRPMVTAPNDITAEAAGALTAVDTGQASATDLVGVVSLTSDAPEFFPTGSTLVIWTAVDEAGNSGTDTQLIIVQDTTAPVITPPADITVIATGALTPVSIAMATATDAVGVVSLTNDAPASFPFGVTIVTWTAVDKAGNTGTAIQKITVLDPTEISLEKAEVDWDKNSFKLYGAITLPSWLAHSELTPSGDVSVDLSALGTIVNQPISFTVKGEHGNKWEYKNKAASNGITAYKISWKGARFEYNKEIKIKSEHIGVDSATLEIEKNGFVGPVTITVGGHQIHIDDSGAVSVTPENSLVIDVDDDGEIEVELPFTLSAATVIQVTPGALPAFDIAVADYLTTAQGKFEIKSKFLPGGLTGDVRPATLNVGLSLGQIGLSDSFEIGRLDWKELKAKEWKFKN